MPRRIFLTLSIWLLAGACLFGADKKKVLLIGRDRDNHPFGTHEYLTDCQLLAKCLQQTPGVEAVVSNGWPKDDAVLKDVSAIVLCTARGGDVLLGGPHRKQAEELIRNGVGLTAVHWGTGTENADAGEAFLKALGGWFSGKFSKLNTTTTRLMQADPKHPVSRGWKDYDLRDEYYLQLRYQPESKPVMKVRIGDTDHTVGWVYERPGAKDGRSFGFVCGHFHANFGEKAFRQAIVNGILWTMHIDVPEGGAPCEITPKDMELPPDTRPKKK
jgi:type 1 glutamine amidotransferase